MKITQAVCLVAASALLAGVPAAAQQNRSTEWRTKKLDTVKYSKVDSRRTFADYSRCVVQWRYEKARGLVLAPYGSAEQAKAANQIIRDEDRCLDGGFDGVQMSIRPEVLAGGVAQMLVLKDYPDLPTVVGSYKPTAEEEQARSAQLNGAERFGRCLVYLDPASVLSLLSSRPSTPQETQAINALREDMSMCVGPGTTLKINQMFVRNMTGVAGYRLAQQISPRGPAAAASPR